MDLIQGVQLISDIATGSGLILGVIQLKKYTAEKVLEDKTRRAELINKLYLDYINSSEMHEIYYEIEYGKFTYDSKFHLSEKEKSLDKLLSHFSNICKLYNSGLLKREDIEFFEHEIDTIYNNEEVVKYLEFIKMLSDAKGIDSKFQYISIVGLEFEKQKRLQGGK